MKRLSRLVLAVAVFLFLFSGFAAADYVYTKNKEHLGGDLTPVEAHAMLKKDPKHTFLVDCRTQAEYQFVGHPEEAFNIPVAFLATKATKKGYAEEPNPNFGQDLLARFNPETDTLIIFCRSGNRSCAACNEAIKAGFKEEKVFNMMGGFEGDKNGNKDSMFHGQRWGGGWKNEGLPWTYSMDSNLIYKPDLMEN